MPLSKPIPSTPAEGDQTTGQPDKLLDRQGILQLLHIRVRTLQSWRSNGILPYSKIRNKIYDRQRDVEEILQKKEGMWKGASIKNSGAVYRPAATVSCFAGYGKKAGKTQAVFSGNGGCGTS